MKRGAIDNLDLRHQQTMEFFGIIQKNKQITKSQFQQIIKKRKYTKLECARPALYAFVRKHIRNFYLKKSRKHLQKTLNSKPDKYWSYRVSIIKYWDIAIVAMQWLEPGGAEEFAIEALKTLESNTNLKIVLTIDHYAEQKFLQQIPDNIFIVPLYTEEGRYTLEEIIKASRVHLVHINHSSYIYGLLRKIRWNSPQALVIDSLHIVESGTGGFVHLSLLNSECIDITHVISESLKKYILNFDFATGRRPNIEVSYLVDKSWNVMVSPKSDLQTDKIRFGFVGRLSTQKQPELFILLCKKISKKHPSSEFHIFGDGEKRKNLEHMAQKLKLNIVFHGHESDRNRIFESIDVLLITSENEGLALVVFEALERGIWVLSLNVGAHREIIPDYLIINLDTKNIYSLFLKKLNELKNSSELRNEMWGQYLVLGDKIPSKNWASHFQHTLSKIK